LKVLPTILLSAIAITGLGQTKPAIDCRDVGALLQDVAKYEGSARWTKVTDSLLVVCPNSAGLWGDKAVVHIVRGQYIEGFRYLEKAVELNPIYYLGYRAWYRMRYLHDYDGAIRDLDQLEKVAGHTLVYVVNSHMYMLKGTAYKEMGNYEKALELYNIAIEEQISSKGAEWVGMYDYLYRGVVKYQMGDHDGAIADFDLETKQFESLADTYYYRGLAYAATSRKDEARLDLERAKELMLSLGQKRWEGYVTLPDEVFLSNIEKALLRLY
jgi:tetratricopeptide (TPR) repeat protein